MNENVSGSTDLPQLDVKVYYIVADTEGIWLTETPDDEDEILFGTTDLFTAERALCRQISLCD